MLIVDDLIGEVPEEALVGKELQPSRTVYGTFGKFVRLVMCEECEHSYYSERYCSEGQRHLMCGLFGHKTGKADYCSKGERHDA